MREPDQFAVIGPTSSLRFVRAAAQARDPMLERRLRRRRNHTRSRSRSTRTGARKIRGTDIAGRSPAGRCLRIVGAPHLRSAVHRPLVSSRQQAIRARRRDPVACPIQRGNLARRLSVCVERDQRRDLILCATCSVSGSADDRARRGQLFMSLADGGWLVCTSSATAQNAAPFAPIVTRHGVFIAGSGARGLHRSSSLRADVDVEARRGAPAFDIHTPDEAVDLLAAGSTCRRG